MKHPATAPLTDPYDPLLANALAQAPGPVLWVVDEHITTPSHWLRARQADVTLISNRHDSYREAQQAGITAYFNDMCLSAPGTPFGSVVYRISKEKALVHHVINASKTVLADNGCLFLIGGKQEGIKTYIDKAAGALGPLVFQTNGDHSSRLACLQKSAALSDAPFLDDKHYPDVRLMAEEDGLQFYSKPGQFGWDKIDQGSAFLVAHFATLFSAKAPGAVVDLGCGYGYLALHVSRYHPETLVATDNNAAAIASCQFNFTHNGISNGTVIADDCGSQITERFDTLVCNPPFHQGFSTNSDMTDRFLAHTRRLLKPSGQALFVVNQFIPLEQKAAGLFRKVEVFGRNKGFKLVRLAGASADRSRARL